jgi:hypothetical protein
MREVGAGRGAASFAAVAFAPSEVDRHLNKAEERGKMRISQNKKRKKTKKERRKEGKKEGRKEDLVLFGNDSVGRDDSEGLRVLFVE